jgi:hypothetical protein
VLESEVIGTLNVESSELMTVFWWGARGLVRPRKLSCDVTEVCCDSGSWYWLGSLPAFDDVIDMCRGGTRSFVSERARSLKFSRGRVCGNELY